MSTTSIRYRLTKCQIQFWNTNGYLIVRKLLTPDEVAEIRDNFTALATSSQGVPGYWVPDLTPAGAVDPLRRYPRVMQPHRWETSGMAKRYLLHPRVQAVLTQLLGAEPLAAQSMYYFKPPGARGQALHQDNFYLQVRPHTCLAAWTAIDPATPENGGLYVVPGTHTMPVVCPEVANQDESFTTHLVKAPAGKKAIPAELQPGDTLFFNGNVVHGSPPNRSKTQWRRSFICHYLPRSAEHISKYYAPLFDFTGAPVPMDTSEDGGPCGPEFAGVEYYGTNGPWH